MPEQAPHATTKNPVGAAVLGPPEIPAPTKGRGNSETPVRAAGLGLPEIPAPYENRKSPGGAALRGRRGQASQESIFRGAERFYLHPASTKHAPSSQGHGSSIDNNTELTNHKEKILCAT